MSANSLKIFSWIFFSFIESTELVGSSRRIMSESFAARIPLAKAKRCFSPPDKETPFSWTFVSTPFSSLSTTVLNCAISIAFFKSDSFENMSIVMLYRIVSLNISGSCGIRVTDCFRVWIPCGRDLLSQVISADCGR